jgi:hypothetical protein
MVAGMGEGAGGVLAAYLAQTLILALTGDVKS